MRAEAPVEIVLRFQRIGLDVLRQELRGDFVGHIGGGAGGVLRASGLVEGAAGQFVELNVAGDSNMPDNAGAGEGFRIYWSQPCPTLRECASCRTGTCPGCGTCRSRRTRRTNPHSLKRAWFLSALRPCSAHRRSRRPAVHDLSRSEK